MAGMMLNAAPGADRSELGRVAARKVEPDKVEPDKVEPGKLGPGEAEAGNAEPGKAAPGKAAPVTIGVPSNKSSRPRPWMVRS